MLKFSKHGGNMRLIETSEFQYNLPLGPQTYISWKPEMNVLALVYLLPL